MVKRLNCLDCSFTDFTSSELIGINLRKYVILSLDRFVIHKRDCSTVQK